MKNRLCSRGTDPSENTKFNRLTAKILMSAALFTLFTAAFTSCTKKTAVKSEKIVMTYVASPLNVPSILEKEDGTFAKSFSKEGLGFEYSPLDSGADQTAALASGDIHFLNAVGGSSVVIAASNGADIKMLSMYSVAPKAFAMFSNDASLNTPQSLKGLTIAGPKGTNLHELLASYLATVGMTMNDVNFISMTIPAATAALESKSIDAALVGGPAAYNMEKSGKHKICDGEGLISSSIVTACSQKFADSNPSLVKIFLETQKQIVKSMNEDRQKSFETTANALGLDVSAIEEMYSLYDFDTEFTEEKLDALQGTERFLYDAGLIENHVDVKSLVLKQ